MQRKEALRFLEELIRECPGHRADYYLTAASAETGITPRKLSEYLKILHQSGRITLHNDRFYPADMRPEEVEAREKALLAWLDSKIQAVTPVTPDVTPVTGQQTPGDVTRVTSRERESEEEAWYLVVYDIRNDVSGSDRVKIYRSLRKAADEVIKSGGMVERIQMSVWRVRGKHNALLFASAIPESKSRIRVFRIMEEG